MAILLFRVFKAQGRFLGRVKVHSVIGDHLIEGEDNKPGTMRLGADSDPDKSARNIFLPIDHRDGSNPNIAAQHPYPGVFIYRFSEGFNYPNANHYTDYLVETIFKETQRTNPNSYARPGDRPWNDPGPKRGKEVNPDDHRPTLKAIILDFSSVNNVDLTSVQTLIDVRNQLDRYTAPERVQWHIACINNRWTKRALAAAGFGYPTTDDAGYQRWKPIFSVAELGGSLSAAAQAEEDERREMYKSNIKDVETGQREVDSIRASDSGTSDVEGQLQKSKAYHSKSNVRVAVVHGLNRPFFHMDLTSALQSAIHNSELYAKTEEVPSKAFDV